MMEKGKCLQCDQETNETINRVVRDSCGHYKCRLCLLKEDIKCSACDEQSKNLVSDSDRLTNASRENKNGENLEMTEFEDNSEHITKNNTVIVVKNQSVPKPNIKEKPFKKKSTKKSNVLPVHIILDSGVNSPKSYVCTICNKKFQARSQIYYHSFCNSTNPLSCSFCPKTFVKKSQLKYHLDVHAGNKAFVCNNCNASFYEKSKLVRHLKIHSGIKEFSCSLCESKFSNGRALKVHNLIHSGLKPHMCKTCGKAYRDSSNLRKHEISSHSVDSSLPKFSCLECGKSYKRKWRLVEHTNTHTKSKVFNCSICMRTFYNKKDKKRHEDIHTDNRHFQCRVCESTFFKRKDNLERHFRTSHPDVDLADLPSMTVIKKISTLNLSADISQPDKKTKAARKNSNRKNSSLTNSGKSGATSSIASTKIFLGNTFDNKPLEDDYYQNKSEFRNYKIYIPKKLNSFSQITSHYSETDSHSVLTNDKYRDSEYNPINLSNSLYKACSSDFHTLHSQPDNPSRLEIIEANNKRQSVIFNSSISDLNSEDDSSYLIPLLGENRSQKGKLIIDESADSNTTIITNENLDSFQSGINTNLTYKTVNFEEIGQGKVPPDKKISHSLAPSTSKSLKKTINVSDVYKQLFPDSNQDNFAIKKASSLSKKVNKAFSHISNKNLKMCDSLEEKNLQKITYKHKKVHYDSNKYATKKKPNDAFEEKSCNLVGGITVPQEQKNLDPNSPKNCNPEKKELKSYFSPESLELYKKILIPSYKGSTTTSTKHLQRDLGNNVPPLAPISNHFPPAENHPEMQKTLYEELTLPHLVPLGKKIDKIESENQSQLAQYQLSTFHKPSSTHPTDIHWRRRLAHSSNQDK